MAFRTEEKGHVYGYIAADTPSQAVLAAQRLFFLGCQHIFTDSRSGRLSCRKGWQRLCKVIREGDRVLLPSLRTLGDRPSRQRPYQQQIEATGASVFVVTEKGKDMLPLNELFVETMPEGCAA